MKALGQGQEDGVARGTETVLTPRFVPCRCTGGCVPGGHGGRYEP